MTELEHELQDLLITRGDLELAETEAERWPDTSQGKPGRWWDTPRWRCVNQHVSTFYIGTDAGGKCPACGSIIFLTFPEDRDGPLPEYPT